MDLELTKEQQEELKQLRSGSECQKQIALCDGDFKNLPKVRKIGMDDLLECTDKRAAACPQALPYGSTYFCKCPARAYVFRKLGI